MSKTLGSNVGKYCVIRTYASGVHIGVVDFVEEGISGFSANISEARRLHYWEGAFTLHAVADDGINLKKSRLSEVKKSPYSISQVIEILPVSIDLIDVYKTAKAHAI